MTVILANIVSRIVRECQRDSLKQMFNYYHSCWYSGWVGILCCSFCYSGLYTNRSTCCVTAALHNMYLACVVCHRAPSPVFTLCDLFPPYFAR